MTTEALPLPAPAAEESCKGTLWEGQKSSEAFRGGNGDMAKNVALTTSLDDSGVPHLDNALISFDEDTLVGHPFTSGQKNASFHESSSLLTSSEMFKMADDDQRQDGGHFAPQGKIPDTSSEQLKAADTSSLSAHGEAGSHSACQGQTREAFSEAPSPVENSEQTTGKEEERPHNCQDMHPAGMADSLKGLEPLDASSKPGQGEKGSHCDTSEVWPEPQQSGSGISNHLGAGEERQEMDRHGETLGLASELPAQPAAPGGLEEKSCSAKNNQNYLLPESPNLLLQGSDSPSQPQEGSPPFFPGHDPRGASSAESQGAFSAADVNEDLRPRDRESTEACGESVPGGQKPLGEDPRDLKGQLLEGTPVGNSQPREEEAEGASQALATTGPPPSVGAGGQQRAAGTGCENSFPEAVPLLSPGATGDSPRPAHEGLAPGHDEEGAREGPSTIDSCGPAGSTETPPQGEAGAKAAVQPEEGEGVAGDARPDSPTGAQVVLREGPSLASGTGTSPEDPPKIMVLACAREPLEAGGHDSQELSSLRYLGPASEQSGPQAKPRGGLPFLPKEPADTEDQGDTTDTPVPAAGPPTDRVENEAGPQENHYPTAETPIEREIRLHLEREELLRQQRGLARARGHQELVEVRIRPILSQSVPASPLAKEKELQWAGAQMQREIQRECQREEDLVQLGKVRGAYDRGTPQELQEKKMIFEQPAASDPLAPTKTGPSGSEGARERSFAETDGAPGPGGPAAQQQALAERPSAANPFFCLRAKSCQSLLEREVQEVQERERELQRQRLKIYGAVSPQQPPEGASEWDEEVPFQPEKLPCKKLEVTWPPPSPSEPCQVNGLPQLERSPRSRQKSALIQRWESGTVGNQESLA